jgi:predicted lipoprotein
MATSAEQTSNSTYKELKTTMKYSRIILLAAAIFAALYFSFYTENLTEKQKREEMSKYNPAQLVNSFMKDSLISLEQKALAISVFAEGIKNNTDDFEKKHGKTLGIGSPIFYIVKGECSEAQLIDNEEIHATADGINIKIPVKYIFGNNARDASGWYNIDNFKNTMDFNAVSAEMNKYITQQMQKFQMSEDGKLTFVGAVAVPAQTAEISSLVITPYILK